MLSFKQAKSELAPTLNSEMESINNLRIEIKEIQFSHNKMESILNDSNKTKPIERIKKADNTNEIMEPIDPIESMMNPLDAAYRDANHVLESLSLGKNQYWDEQKNLCIDYLSITSMAHEQVLLEESKKECRKKLCLKQVTEKHISSCNNLKQYQNTSKTHCYLY